MSIEEWILPATVKIPRAHVNIYMFNISLNVDPLLKSLKVLSSRRGLETLINALNLLGEVEYAVIVDCNFVNE